MTNSRDSMDGVVEPTTADRRRFASICDNAAGQHVVGRCLIPRAVTAVCVEEPTRDGPIQLKSFVDLNEVADDFNEVADVLPRIALAGCMAEAKGRLERASGRRVSFMQDDWHETLNVLYHHLGVVRPNEDGHGFYVPFLFDVEDTELISAGGHITGAALLALNAAGPAERHGLARAYVANSGLLDQDPPLASGDQEFPWESVRLVADLLAGNPGVSFSSEALRAYCQRRRLDPPWGVRLSDRQLSLLRDQADPEAVALREYLWGVGP